MLSQVIHCLSYEPWFKSTVTGFCQLSPPSVDRFTTRPWGATNLSITKPTIIHTLCLAS